ncbi:photosystem II biogenesis protein Psp29 [Cyanobium sp. NIES-981]|uniref:photosystem II biogenesis protein Psp29 n=1 Tax=Cyanobium sp. NIES-981 TaxID=1851505 RepID=UPI0007DDD3E9|nr:photosystem II biogenesis protein Psp29 [Cyanobium sp. NIES-981]SBO42163.1 Protein Thf1 [Cyanobium sp. NIES-981]
MSAALTVSDSKRAFRRAFPHVIAPLYRRMVDELLVELHLLSRQRGFEANPLFACGLIQVFDGFAKGYRPDGHKAALLAALCSATGFDAEALRREAEASRNAMGNHTVEEVKGWIEHQGEGAPEPLASALASIRRPDFHYSRLMAVGLLSLLEEARGADAMDPATLRSYAQELAAAIGLMRERVDKDLSLYATNLEKLAQAVALMEETVAAERRKRERQQAGLTDAPAGSMAELKAESAPEAETAPPPSSATADAPTAH